MTEADFIQNYLHPLTNGNKFARSLMDDVAQIGSIIANTDTTIEGVHILENLPANFIAYKAMARSVSDIFAKNGKPIGYFLNLIFPKTFQRFEELMQGFSNFNKRHKIDLLGGDTSTHNAENIIIVVTVLAESENSPKRSDAKIGDGIFITKKVGEAFFGYSKILEFQKNKKKINFDDPQIREYLCPSLVTISDFSKINASMDISDGILDDSRKMAKASNCCFEIDFNAIPHCGELNKNSLKFGDDYNILVTSQEEFLQNFTKIGTVKNGTGVILKNCPFAFDYEGFDHFTNS